MSAERCAGSGVETTSAKAVRNSPASVSGNLIRSSGTWAGRRIATGSPTRNLPRAVRVLCSIKRPSGRRVPFPQSSTIRNCVFWFARNGLGLFQVITVSGTLQKSGGTIEGDHLSGALQKSGGTTEGDHREPQVP